MASIDDLPVELLHAILAPASLRMAVKISHVSRFWRECCISYTEFWCMIHICKTDLKHMDIFCDFFERSRERRICLVMDFSMPVIDRVEFHRFMVLVASHIERCHQIWICASPDTYYTMITIFYDKKYVEPYRIHLDIPADFTMKQGWHDDEDSLLPWFDSLYVPLSSAAVDAVLGSDGQLNPWALYGPKQLQFYRVAIPFLGQQSAKRATTFPFHHSVTYLALSELRASEDSDGEELDCYPFFQALETPNLQHLEIAGIDMGERVWNDFIAALPDTPRYPFLTELVLREMHIYDMPLDTFISLLQSTPALETLVFLDCTGGSHLILLDLIAEKEWLCESLQKVRVEEVTAVWSEIRDLDTAGREVVFLSSPTDSGPTRSTRDSEALLPGALLPWF
ncbi:hypothetical protein B0H10DRAFT_1968494 [Mycena sp. CBHHK59/15]|nr:hypothetical protein B0H10DRAFT_2204550 [Mycena sp. CBHHK59/15]KAJ6552155.1 hypothetical protein B0H10DRAFT_1968494 [Mycena sp. CBHHK59/15]